MTRYLNEDDPCPACGGELRYGYCCDGYEDEGEWVPCTEDWYYCLNCGKTYLYGETDILDG